MFGCLGRLVWCVCLMVVAEFRGIRSALESTVLEVLIQLSIAWGSSRGAFVRDVLLSDLRNLVVTEGCGCWGTGFS